MFPCEMARYIAVFSGEARKYEPFGGRRAGKTSGLRHLSGGIWAHEWKGPISALVAPSPDFHAAGLFQTGAAQAFQKVFALVLPERKLPRHPFQRDVGLRATQLLQHGSGEVHFTRHGGGRGDHPIGAGEVVALTDAL